MSKTPAFSPWLIIGLVVVIAGGTYIVLDRASKAPVSSPTPIPVAITATPDPTAGWLTYTNTSLGISFKYPQGYVVEMKTNFPDTIYVSNYSQSKVVGITDVPGDWVAVDVTADAQAQVDWNAGLSYTKQQLPTLAATTATTTDGAGTFSYYEWYSAQAGDYSIEAGNGRLDQVDLSLSLSNGKAFRARNFDNYDWTPTDSAVKGKALLLEILKTATSA